MAEAKKDTKKAAKKEVAELTLNELNNMARKGYKSRQEAKKKLLLAELTKTLK